MNEIEKLINDLFEKHEKKHELAGMVSFLSFDSLFDLLEYVESVPEQEQAKIERFKNAYAELHTARAEVLKFIFSTISEMNTGELENLEKLLTRGLA